jgi:hypothetical protein
MSFRATGRKKNAMPVRIMFSQWRYLVGMEVHVRLGPGSFVTGVVDAALHDSSLLWLTPPGGFRRIVEKSEGHEVWVES